MKILKANESFCNFYPNLPKTSFIHKMSKNKAQTRNEQLLNNPKWKSASIIDHLVILLKLTQNFLQFQNEQT